MKTETIQIYSFNELSEEVQKAVIKKERECIEIELCFFSEYCEEQIKEAGFLSNINLTYSLNNSQGDGFSFNCTHYIKFKELFESILGNQKQSTIDLIINNCEFVLNRKYSRHSYPSRSDVRFELDCFESPNIVELVNKVQNNLRDIYINLCKELEKQGYDEIDYQYSDEYIIEYLLEGEFLKDGAKW
jgi:glutamate racemase